MTEYVFHTLEANLQHQYSFKESRRKHELTEPLGLRMNATYKNLLVEAARLDYKRFQEWRKKITLK